VERLREPARVSVSPKPVRKMLATFASGTPSPVCNHAAQAMAFGPTCDAAAPVAVEVWRPSRPTTRRRHC
jgi:hypothetical protein